MSETTPEERADACCATFPDDMTSASYEEIRDLIAASITTAENELLDVVAAKVLAFMPGNPFGKLASDLIKLYKHN